MAESNIDETLVSNYKMLYANKSDEELREIVMRNNRLVLGVPAIPDAKTLAQAKAWVAESTACSQIVTEREREIKDRGLELQKYWDQEDARKRAAILSLEAAISPNGQLVAAILEEEGPLSEGEIAGWCDELAQVPDEDFLNLLEKLVAEGVIVKDEAGKYSLFRVCTPSLYPSNPVQWALEKADTIGYKEPYMKELKLALKILWIEKKPLCVEDFAKKALKYDFVAEEDTEIGREACESLARMSYVAMESMFSPLTKNKVIKEKWLNGDVYKYRYYYFSMLGDPDIKEESVGGEE